jgi:hypothetical protein
MYICGVPNGKSHWQKEKIERINVEVIFDDYFKYWRSIFMSNKKYVYNYDIEECNQLFKRGVFPIGCGKHDKTGNVFHVFCVNSRYLKVLEDIRFLASQGAENNRTPR